MTQLNPPPAAVADLLIQMTRLDWPTDEADRRRYFDILDLDELDTAPERDDEPDTRMIRFTTALPYVNGTCTMVPRRISWSQPVLLRRAHRERT